MPFFRQTRKFACSCIESDMSDMSCVVRRRNVHGCCRWRVCYSLLWIQFDLYFQHTWLPWPNPLTNLSKTPFSRIFSSLDFWSVKGTVLYTFVTWDFDKVECDLNDLSDLSEDTVWPIISFVFYMKREKGKEKKREEKGQ